MLVAVSFNDPGRMTMAKDLKKEDVNNAEAKAESNIQNMGVIIIIMVAACYFDGHHHALWALMTLPFFFTETRNLLLKYFGGKPSSGQAACILLSLAVIGLICLNLSPPPPDVDGKRAAQEQADRESNTKYTLLAAAERAIKERLKDADSAQFRNESVHKNGKGLIVCGEVNAKNGFGGFSGFKHFVSMGTDTTTFLEDQTRGFGKVWNGFCLKDQI
jgi:hypothetical protein